MLKNCFKIAYRNVLRHKSYSMINILGLSVGIACCILILAYIEYEFSFDRFHDNADDIYRIVTTTNTNGSITSSPSAPTPFAPAMIKDYSEIVDAVRIAPTVKRSFRYEDKKYFETGVYYADKSLFSVFSFELVEGNPETALEAPFTMVLTQEMAARYFGDESPVGKTMNWDNNFDYTITGVVKNPPENSHFRFNAIASFTTFFRYDPRLETKWLGWNVFTYLLLRENTDHKLFELKFDDFVDKYLGDILRSRGTEMHAGLQPLKDIHLHSNFAGELGTNSNIRIIYAFSAIAVIILLIACINFMNLATARSEGRAKEVGMRKVFGAERRRLILQFLGESSLFAAAALICAVVIARLALPYFSMLAGREISLNILGIPRLAAGIAGIVVFTGIFAGSYPAFFLSSFRPVSALRGVAYRGRGNPLFRSTLVVFQFTISIFLIIFTLIILNQQKYMHNKDLGFNKEHLLVIAVQNKEVRLGLESFKDELLKINGVKSACASSMVSGELYLFSNRTFPEGYDRDQSVTMDNFLVDHGYFDTFGINIVNGRAFSKDITTEIQTGVLINETAAGVLGWDNPVGKVIDIETGLVGSKSNRIRRIVIGVFSDMHIRSLYSPIAPAFVRYISNEGPIENRARRLTLRLDTGDLPGTMKLIEQKWNEVHPALPYYYFFLDDSYDSLHRAEQRLGNIFRAFSVLTVIIGCLGLFGLASFTAEQRTREIGIRKVLGSTVGSVVMLLCRDFVRLIVIANVIAWPAAYFAVGRWLQDFPYRVDAGPGAFVQTATLILVIALLTVGFQALKAARANPVDSLRHE